MEIRKIIGFGKNSLIISLPREWVSKNGLSKGQEVFIDDVQNELRIKSTNFDNAKIEKKIEINTDDLTLLAVKREICSNYINNSNLIELKGKAILDYSYEIKNYLREFMVFEIIEERDDFIIAKDYLNLDNVEKEQIIDRMVSIMKSMFDDLRKQINPEIYESIANRDSQINRYYFLMERFARYHLSKKSNEDYVKILDFVQTSILIESIGDYIKHLSGRILSGHLIIDNKTALFLEKCANYFSENIASFLDNDKEKFISITNYYRNNLFSEIQRLNVSDVDKESFIVVVRNIHKSARPVIGFSKSL